MIIIIFTYLFLSEMSKVLDRNINFAMLIFTVKIFHCNFLNELINTN